MTYHLKKKNLSVWQEFVGEKPGNPHLYNETIFESFETIKRKSKELLIGTGRHQQVIIWLSVMVNQKFTFFIQLFISKKLFDWYHIKMEFLINKA